MTKEQGALLALLRCAIRGETVSAEEADVAWPEIEREARLHSVTLFLQGQWAAVKAAIPPEVYERIAKASYHTVSENMRTDYAQQELVRLLEESGYRYVILKGAASAAYYPQPECRALGDVDFLVERGDEEDIHHRLLQAGFSATHEEHERHTVYRKHGACLEMHREIAGIPHGEAGVRIRAFLKTVFEASQPAATGNFAVPSDRHHAVILLLHMQHHMLGEGFGLRHLCDWACFVNQTAQCPFWREMLIPFLDRAGLLVYASVMTGVCGKYLGTAIPEGLPPADETLCEAIMEDVLSAGNFGRKDAARIGSEKLVSNRGKDGTAHSAGFYLFANLKATVYEKHPVVKKYKILYPMYALYRLTRYGWLMLIGKREPLHRILPQATKRKAVYDQLRIFEVTDL